MVINNAVTSISSTILGPDSFGLGVRQTDSAHLLVGGMYFCVRQYTPSATVFAVEDLFAITVAALDPAT